MNADEYFRTDWHAMAGRLATMLARRGVSGADRDDVIQETAFRLYRSWDLIDQDRDLEPYIRTIALNVWRSDLRRNRPEDAYENVPEPTSVSDMVERTCEAREQLSLIRRALERMRPEQQVLLRGLAEEELGVVSASGPSSDATRMARMRARKQLQAVLSAASSVGVILGAAFRFGRRRQVASLTALSAATAMTLAVLVSVGPSEAHMHTSPQGAAHVQQVREARETFSTRVVRPATPAAVAKRDPVRRGPERLPFYTVPLGPAEAGIHFRADVAGQGLEVRDGGTLPTCTFGVTAAPSVLRCPE